MVKRVFRFRRNDRKKRKGLVAIALFVGRYVGDDGNGDGDGIGGKESFVGEQN